MRACKLTHELYYLEVLDIFKAILIIAVIAPSYDYSINGECGEAWYSYSGGNFLQSLLLCVGEAAGQSGLGPPIGPPGHVTRAGALTGGEESGEMV